MVKRPPLLHGIIVRDNSALIVTTDFCLKKMDFNLQKTFNVRLDLSENSKGKVSQMVEEHNSDLNHLSTLQFIGYNCFGGECTIDSQTILKRLMFPGNRIETNRSFNLSKKFKSYLATKMEYRYSTTGFKSNSQEDEKVKKTVSYRLENEPFSIQEIGDDDDLLVQDLEYTIGEVQKILKEKKALAKLASDKNKNEQNPCRSVISFLNRLLNCLEDMLRQEQ